MILLYILLLVVLILNTMFCFTLCLISLANIKYNNNNIYLMSNIYKIEIQLPTRVANCHIFLESGDNKYYMTNCYMDQEPAKQPEETVPRNANSFSQSPAYIIVNDNLHNQNIILFFVTQYFPKLQVVL